MSTGHIWLTDDPDKVHLDRSPKALWVYADKWRKPIADRTIPASRYLDDPWKSLQDVETLVIVGMSAIVTPSNRTKTGPYLNEPFNIHRESVDRTLFVGEPWRAWWHWGCVGAKWAGVSHSFALEGLWNQYMDARRDDPCSLQSFLSMGENVVVSGSNTPRFNGMSVETIHVDGDVLDRYQEEKAMAFEQETTWRGLVRRLGAFAQEVEPLRSMPRLSDLFKCLGIKKPEIIATDLPVDVWQVSHFQYIIDLVDGIADGFRKEDAWTP